MKKEGIQHYSDLTHGMAVINSSLCIHYVIAGQGARTIVLLRGFQSINHF